MYGRSDEINENTLIEKPKLEPNQSSLFNRPFSCNLFPISDINKFQNCTQSTMDTRRNRTKSSAKLQQAASKIFT